MAPFGFRFRVVSFALALGASFLATGAHAEGPGAEVTTAAPASSSEVPPLPEPYETSKGPEVPHWYGWQTLLVDGASVAAGIGVGTSSASPGAGSAVWLGGYALGGPIVHWAHGHAGRGFASLGLRVGAPLVFGCAGALLGSGHDSDSGDAAAGAVIGAFAGYVSAVVLDSAVLAHETIPAEEVEPDDTSAREEARKEERRMFKWTPSVSLPRGGGATAGISGTF